MPKEKYLSKSLLFDFELAGLDPLTQYRQCIQVTDCFSLNSVGGK